MGEAPTVTEQRSMSVTVKKANFGIKLPRVRTSILGQVVSNIEVRGIVTSLCQWKCRIGIVGSREWENKDANARRSAGNYRRCRSVR